MAPGGDHGVNIHGDGRSQNSPNVVWVGNAVKDKHARACRAIGQEIFQIDVRERLRFEHNTLMHGVVADKLRQRGFFGHLKLAFARKEGLITLCLIGEDIERKAPPLRIAQGMFHGMMAIKPA
jgi:hypothetical protein